MKKPLIGIGVVTFNRLETLKITLNKIIEHTTGEYQLVVADDGSTDGTIQYLQNNNFSYVTGKNRGVCINKSRALFYLKDCDYIYIMEDDVYPNKKGWQEVYIEGIKESGIEYFSRTLSSWDIHKNHRKHRTWVIDDPPNRECKFTYLESTGCPGQMYILTQNVLKTVGGPSTDFRGYGHGHGDWTYRIKKMGFTKKKYTYRQIDIREGRDALRSPGALPSVTGDEHKKQQLEYNKDVKRKKRNYYAKTGDFYCGDYLNIKDPLYNEEYFNRSE